MHPEINYILFDLIGTTIQDTHNGESLVLDCFFESFRQNGLSIDFDRINRQRGKTKRDAIENLLADEKINPGLPEKIYSDFIGLLKKSITHFKEVKSASTVFRYLKEKNIKIGLGSGLPKDFLVAIIRQTGWDINQFDYIGSSDELGKGRPDPAMIFDSMNKLKIGDPSKILKVGDTIADIQEGKNAGVLTAAVLTGTQKKDELLACHPDYLFEDINELMNVL